MTTHIPFTVGQSVYILNSHRNRASLGRVTEIRPETRTMLVLDVEKNQGPFAYDAIGGEANGEGYHWVSGAVPARVVSLMDPEAIALRSTTERILASTRRYDAVVAAAAAMKAAELADGDTFKAFYDLLDAVEDWGDAVNA